MNNIRVLNASPLIVLAKAGLLKMVSPLSKIWLIPSGVVKEINRKSSIEDIVSELENNADVKIKSVKNINPLVANWNLGQGESEVITLAIEEGSTAVLDDLQAGKCATVLNVKLMGTLGLLLLAKRKGIVNRIQPLFERVVQAGLYIEQGLIDNLLKSIDEIKKTTEK